jgi:60 kDa SS-A/Ro ribonucleoprotein
MNPALLLLTGSRNWSIVARRLSLPTLPMRHGPFNTFGTSRCTSWRNLRSWSRLTANDLTRVIQRADEIAEFLAIFTSDRTGQKKLNKIPNQVKVGLDRALRKFDAYQLAKYDRQNAAIKLRDVIRILHPKPRNVEQSELWRKAVAGTLPTPDTWEVALTQSGGENKALVWQRLLIENKLGPLALIRNLRNMEQAGVNKGLIREALRNAAPDKILPFRFIAAARSAPAFEPELEQMMLGNLAGMRKLPGKTVILVDNSPSMNMSKVSAKSDLTRRDAATALAIMLREVCAEVEVVSFSSDVATVPPRRGFALGDAIRGAVPSNGTLIGKAINAAGRIGYDRLIVITDEESQDSVGKPLPNTLAYMLNVSGSQNGVGYGDWTRITGWSENVVRFIQASEESQGVF